MQLPKDSLRELPGGELPGGYPYSRLRLQACIWSLGVYEGYVKASMGEPTLNPYRPDGTAAQGSGRDIFQLALRP